MKIPFAASPRSRRVPAPSVTNPGANSWAGTPADRYALTNALAPAPLNAANTAFAALVRIAAT